MKIEISEKTAERLGTAHHRIGVGTSGRLLGRVLNKLSAQVPDDERERDGIRDIANGSGEWTPGTREVKLHGVEMEETLQKSAKALGLSPEDAFAKGVDALLESSPSTVMSG